MPNTGLQRNPINPHFTYDDSRKRDFSTGFSVNRLPSPPSQVRWSPVLPGAGRQMSYHRRPLRVKSTIMSSDKPLSDAEQATWRAQAQASLADQAQIEAADTLDFETFRKAYVDPAGLTVA